MQAINSTTEQAIALVFTIHYDLKEIKPSMVRPSLQAPHSRTQLWINASAAAAAAAAVDAAAACRLQGMHLSAQHPCQLKHPCRHAF
jgi:hypothetical protein